MKKLFPLIMVFLFITMMACFITQVHAMPKFINRTAVIIYHDAWKDAVAATQEKLENRGYDVVVTDDPTEGLNEINDALSELSSGDYMVVYLAGHGSDPRTSDGKSYTDTSKNTALGHYIQFNQGDLKVSQIAPLFEQIAQKGINLTVIDGSCNAGETVYYAMGQKYCAVSTTGLFSPALTGLPDPSISMEKNEQPGAFGLWWSDPNMTASWMDGDIIYNHNERIQQRLFRNDNTEVANASLFWRPFIANLTGLDYGGWNLHYDYCYLFRYIYPNDYASLDQDEKNKFTIDLKTYLATIHVAVDPATPSFNKLTGYLNDNNLMKKAAKIYAAQYDLIWQTLANDPDWDVQADPGKHAADMKDLTPDAYIGEQGFIKIAAETQNLLAVLQAGFAEQETLLKQIDAVVKSSGGKIKPPLTTKIITVPAWPPAPGEQTIKFNNFQKELIKKYKTIEMNLKVDRKHVARFTYGQTPAKTDAAKILSPSAESIKEGAQKVINQGIQFYQPGFKTVIGPEAEISDAAIKGLKPPSLADLVAQFKAITPTLLYTDGRMSFLLSIVEDSISKMQSVNTNPCDLVMY